LSVAVFSFCVVSSISKQIWKKKICGRQNKFVGFVKTLVTFIQTFEGAIYDISLTHPIIALPSLTYHLTFAFTVSVSPPSSRSSPSPSSIVH
jgi:hypothetical protein